MIGKKQIWIEPITTPQQLQELQAAVRTDPPHHNAWWATHICRKEGEVTGYLSCGAMPVLHYWSHSQKMKAADSIQLANMAENIMLLQGHKAIVVPCSPDSPLHGLMTSGFGYTSAAETELFVKDLTQTKRQDDSPRIVRPV